MKKLYLFTALVLNISIVLQQSYATSNNNPLTTDDEILLSRKITPTQQLRNFDNLNPKQKNDVYDDYTTSSIVKPIIKSKPTIADIELGPLSKKLQCIEASLLLGCLLPMWGANIYNAYSELSSVQLLLGAIGSFFFADLLTGIFHLITDTIDGPSHDGKPGFLRRYIHASIFRDGYKHHEYPADIARTSHWESVRGGHYLALPLTLASRFLPSTLQYGLTMTWIIGANNQVPHAIGHGKYKNNPLVKFLKKSHLILDEQEHRQHHNGIHDSHFCVVNGYIMNRVLDSMLLLGSSCLQKASKLCAYFSRS